jgi:hypothetical protein
MLDKTLKTKTDKHLKTVNFSDVAAVVAPARVRITVDGVKPLLTHNPESMGVEKAPGKGSRIPEAEVEAEQGVYRLPDGTCAIKGEAFRGALLGAASAWKAKGKKTMKSLLSHIIVVEELVQLCHPDGKPLKDYAIDSRRAIVQRQGIIRRRPRFDEWSCTFTIEYDPQVVGVKDPGIIASILQDAGGRGDFRPAKRPFDDLSCAQ